MSRRLKWLLLVYLPAAAILAFIAAVAIYTGIRVGRLVRDVTAIVDIHPLNGLLTNLGALLWCATASICLFSSFVESRDGKHSRAQFLLWSGLITLLLLFDDFFLFHEVLAPMYLGVTEIPIFAAYILIVLVYLIVFRNIIFETDYLFLVAALAFFAMSMFADWVEMRIGNWRHFVEEGLKFLGIGNWFAYFAQTCFAFMQNGRARP